MVDRANPDDDFSAAFENFTAPGEGGGKGEGAPPVEEEPAPAAEEEPAPPVEEEPAGEEGAEEEPDGEEGAEEEPAGEEGAEDEPSEEPSEEPSGEGAGDDDLLKRLKNLLKEEPAPAAEEDEEEPAAEPAQLPDLYTDEEKAFLADYEKEWPEVAKAESLRRKAEYRDILGYVFQEMAKYIKPVADTVETLAVRAQYADITERNPDYEDIRDQVFDWVDTQPAYLQTAYKQVMKSGTVEEVNDLFDRFRADKGLPKDKKPVSTGKKIAEPSETAKKAAKSMAPVSTKRSTVPRGDDPDDYDGAFAQFAKSWSKQ